MTIVSRILFSSTSGPPVKLPLVYLNSRGFAPVDPPRRWIRKTMTITATATMSSHFIIALKVASMNGAVDTNHATNPIITTQIINASSVIFLYYLFY